METAAKLAALAMVAAVFCVLLRENGRVQAVLLSLAVCVGILVTGIRFLSPIWSVLEQLRKLSGLDSGITAPLLKVAGIGLLTQAASGVCGDAGEAGLAKAVEVSGAVLGLYASLPLLSAVLVLLEKFLGGAP